jgi:hypothetical protein
MSCQTTTNAAAPAVGRMRVQRPGPRKLRPAHVGRLIQMVRSSAGPAPARRSWERRAPGTGNDQARTSAMSSVSLLQAWKPAAPPALSSSMQLGRAAVISRTRGTLLLPRTQASVAELTRQALAPDEEWAQAGCCLTRPRVVRSGRLRRAGRECPKQARLSGKWWCRPVRRGAFAVWAPGLSGWIVSRCF